MREGVTENEIKRQIEIKRGTEGRGTDGKMGIQRERDSE